MKITIESYGNKFTAELPEDATLDDFMTVTQGLLVSCTFSMDSVKDWIIEKADEYERDNTQD